MIQLHIGQSELERMHRVMIEDADNPESVPKLLELNDSREYVVEIDSETGDILREGI